MNRSDGIPSAAATSSTRRSPGVGTVSRARAGPLDSPASTSAFSTFAAYPQRSQETIASWTLQVPDKLAAAAGLPGPQSPSLKRIGQGAF